MGKFDNFLRFFGLGNTAPLKKPKSGRAGAAVSVIPRSTSFITTSGLDFKILYEVAFKRNPVVYSAIMKVGEACSIPNLIVKDRASGEIKKDHDLLETMRRPNSYTTKKEFIKYIVAHRYIDGNAYVLKARSTNVETMGKLFFQNLNPGDVEIAYSTDNENPIGAYLYKPSGVSEKDADILPPQSVLHFKIIDPDNVLEGLSPLISAFTDIQTDNIATESTFHMAENMNDPGTIYSTDIDLSSDMLQRTEDTLRQKTTKSNLNDLLLLTNGFKPVDHKTNPKDWGFQELRMVTESRMLAPLMIPSMVLSLLSGMENSSYANFNEARGVFWQDVIIPLLNDIAAVIEADPELNPNNDIIEFDLTDIPALEAMRVAEKDATRKDLGLSIIDVDEARSELGYPERTPEQKAAAEKDKQDALSAKQNSVNVTTNNNPKSKNSQKDTKSVKKDPKRSEDVPEERKIEEKDLKLLKQSLGRIGLAVESAKELERIIGTELHFESQEILTIFDTAVEIALEEGDKELSDLKDLKSVKVRGMNKKKFKREVEQKKNEWEERLQQEIKPVISDIIITSGALAAEEVEVELVTAFAIDSKAQLKFIDEYSLTFAKQVSDTTEQIVKDEIARGFKEGKSVGDIRDSLTQRLEKMTDTRAEMIARTETMRAANAGAVETYAEAGVSKKRWLASSDACVYCKAMDGKVIGIRDRFFKKGDNFDPKALTSAGNPAKPLKLEYTDTPYPPLHGRCRCTVLAEFD